MPDIFPFSPKELAVRMKTELAALHRLAAMFQMFYLALMHQDLAGVVICRDAHIFFRR